ncbi:Lar family restriction alleviation protein [Pseudomonas zeae]|uniref:Lar family restriction alleviation protein n=1 Tax=Pseudomonas zeae TaxID=2745510 RepID=UPI0039E009B9
MVMEPLPPDTMELRIATDPGSLLPCPFCGRSPLLVSAIDRRRHGQTPVRYQAKLFCTDRCHAQLVLQHPSSRAAAEWNHRVPASA